jgi:hypothetical protein
VRSPFPPGSGFRLAALAAAVGSIVACNGNDRPSATFPTAVVERGTVAVTASADGVVEPIRRVEV